jgi:hypothetical protein
VSPSEAGGFKDISNFDDMELDMRLLVSFPSRRTSQVDVLIAEGSVRVRV